MDWVKSLQAQALDVMLLPTEGPSKPYGLAILPTPLIRTCEVHYIIQSQFLNVIHLRYGNHPVYVEHRFNETTNEAQSHGVFLFRSFFPSLS